MQETARRAFVATLVALAVVLSALALWKLKAIIALLFLGVHHRGGDAPGRRVARAPPDPARRSACCSTTPCSSGLVALFLWLVVPRALDQVQQALGRTACPPRRQDSSAPRSTRPGSGTRCSSRSSTGSRSCQRRSVVQPGDRRHAEGVRGVRRRSSSPSPPPPTGSSSATGRSALVLSLLPRRHRKVVRDTWDLIDLKLGAFVRGELLLIVFVATLLSLAFWAIGLPYWLLVGVFAGIVEIVPVVGPLAAGGVAIGVGADASSWHTALSPGSPCSPCDCSRTTSSIPRVLGHAVGLSPLARARLGDLDRPSSSAASPSCSRSRSPRSLATLVDVDRARPDPAEEEVPTVLFAGEGVGGRALGLAPAAEDEAAEGEAEPEGAERERADRHRLARRGEPLPAADRLVLLRRQRLAAALLAQGPARSDAEIEVVEDLGRTRP